MTATEIFEQKVRAFVTLQGRPDVDVEALEREVASLRAQVLLFKNALKFIAEGSCGQGPGCSWGKTNAALVCEEQGIPYDPKAHPWSQMWTERADAIKAGSFKPLK